MQLRNRNLRNYVPFWYSFAQLRGGQAGDEFDESKTGQIDGGDPDKHGIKPPDAMGAGA